MSAMGGWKEYEKMFPLAPYDNKRSALRVLLIFVFSYVKPGSHFTVVSNMLICVSVKNY
jgi:hypothetical protein